MPKTQHQLHVLIADDHEMVLEIFALYLTTNADMIVETANSLDDAIAKIEKHGPFDVVLLDLNMPGMNGVSGLQKGIKQNGGKPVAILTGNPAPRMVDEIMSIGGAGIILKTASARSLSNAIRFMSEGEYYMPVSLVRSPNNPANNRGEGGLSEREMMVMTYLAEGRQNKEIALSLNLAEPTIKMHVKAICRKLGAQNRTQAVVLARDLAII